MRTEKKFWERLRKAEDLAHCYLANERPIDSFKSQFDRAIRDAYLAGYRSALEAEDDAIPFWKESKANVDSVKPEKTASSQDRLLTIKEVGLKLGLSRGTIWRMTRAGKFPSKIAVTGTSVRWLESEVEEWIKKRAALGR